jgi:hypothetical protein
VKTKLSHQTQTSNQYNNIKLKPEKYTKHNTIENKNNMMQQNTSSQVSSTEVPKASPDDASTTSIKKFSAQKIWIGIGTLALAALLVVCLAAAGANSSETNLRSQPSNRRRLNAVGPGDAVQLPMIQCPPPDECITVESYDQCRQLEMDGCQRMVSTASCPPKYHCLDMYAQNPTQLPEWGGPVQLPESGDPIQLPEVPSCVPPREGDDCITAGSYQQCLRLAMNGCTTMLTTRSCPPQYQCADPPTVQLPQQSNVKKATKVQPVQLPEVMEPVQLPEIGQPVQLPELDGPVQLPEIARPVQLPEITRPVQLPEAEVQVCAPPDTCSTVASYRQCLNLQKQGCTSIASTMSCPPQYECLAIPVQLPQWSNVKQATRVQHVQLPEVGEPVQLPEVGQPVQLPELDGPVQLPEITRPVQLPEVTLPVQLPEVTLPVQLPEVAEPIQLPEVSRPLQLPAQAAQCVPPRPEDDCVTFTSYQQCLKLFVQGCQNMAATASCPPQYQCLDMDRSQAGRVFTLGH